MKKTILKRPTNLQLIKGLIISIIQAFLKGYSDAIVPSEIEEYKLQRIVDKKNMLNGYAVGVYKGNNKTVFIKTWIGGLKNYGYYELVNEYIASRIIYKKLEAYKFLNKKSKIKSPEPLKYISSKHSLSLVFEHIEGETLASYSLDEKVEALTNIIKGLSKVSNTLTEKEKRQLFKRGKYFYILSLPIHVGITIVSNPKSYKVVFRAFIYCLKSFKFINRANLSIAHRDISFDNILVNKRGIFIVDWSRMALAVPSYDLTYLSISPELRQIVDLVLRKLNCKPNPFLKSHILIQSSQFFGSPEGYDNFYEKQLYKLYS